MPSASIGRTADGANATAAFGVALGSVILALTVASSLVLGAVEGLAVTGRALARDPGPAVAAIEAAHAAAVSRCLGALVAGTVILAVGATAAWRLVLRERMRSHARRSRARLARLGLLAGGLAEEMRAPLEEVRELLGRVRDQLEEQPAWSTFSSNDDPCEQAGAELDRLEGVVRDFLAYTKPEPAPPRIVDVSALVREWVSVLEPELAARDLALVADGLDCPATAVADPAGLKQIFWSLVRNARDAAPRGTIVRVGLERGSERVRLRVSDRGPGIARERRDELFEPFVSTKPDAMGLGLAVSLRLAEAMGASLSVRGGPPGAVFEVGLRRAPPSVRFLIQPPRELQKTED